MRLSRSGDLNLHLLLRPLQQRFDTGPRGCAAGRHPGVPHPVHLLHGSDVRKPDGGFQQFRLVGASLGKIAVDDRQDFRSLLRNPCSDRLGRNYTDVVDTIRELTRRGVIIKTVINGMTFDGSTTDPMQQAVRDALIAFMAATAQAQAEATKSAQRAGIDHKRRVQPNAYLGRKPSYDRATFDRIRLALDSASPPSLSFIAKAEGLSKQTVFRLKQDPQAALGALEAWGL
jgi:Resolvase, N terminal domain